MAQMSEVSEGAVLFVFSKLGAPGCAQLGLLLGELSGRHTGLHHLPGYRSGCVNTGQTILNCLLVSIVTFLPI